MLDLSLLGADSGLRGHARLVSSTAVYKGKIVKLSVDRVIEPGGVEATREVVHHRGSVVVLPRFSNGGVVLVRQFRYATGRMLWELVAGGIERGESPRDAARRELLEEAGYKARSFRALLRFFPSPGFLSEEMHLLEARGLVRAKAQPEADERIEVRRFGREELLRLLRARRIQDGKTLVGLLWLLGFERPRAKR